MQNYGLGVLLFSVGILLYAGPAIALIWTGVLLMLGGAIGVLAKATREGD